MPEEKNITRTSGSIKKFIWLLEIVKIKASRKKYEEIL